MKHLKIKSLGIGLAATMLFVISCTKHTPDVADPVTNLEESAQIQVINSTINATRNYVYVDNVPVNGAALAYGGVFPSAYSFRVNHGARTITIKDTLATSTQTPISFAQNFETGESYTIFTYGITTAAKQLTVKNEIVVPTDTSARLRFANLVYSASPLAAVDVYSQKNGLTTPIFSNVANNTVTGFVSYPSGQTDTLFIYPTGTTSPLLLKAALGSGFTAVATRSYSAVYNGQSTAPKITTFATY